MGRDIYIREGCVGCHSQQVRLLAAEVQRYGSYSLASESVFDHPFLWGSKRTGPDLARLGERYSDEWHRIHLRNPRMVVPESNMPAYPWLEKTSITGQACRTACAPCAWWACRTATRKSPPRPRPSRARRKRTRWWPTCKAGRGRAQGAAGQEGRRRRGSRQESRRRRQAAGPSRPREADHGLHQRNRHRHLDGNLFGIVWWACSRGRQSANRIGDAAVRAAR